MRFGVLGISTCIAVVAFAHGARADFTLGFEAITANNVGDVAIAESQLFVDVSDYGGGQVLFTFRNEGPAASSIADVYFDDGTLLGIAALIDADDGVGGDAGVDFSQSASPPDLPAGSSMSPPFEVTAGFLADSDPPAQPNGVNPGESLGVIFDLQTGGVFDDVIAELTDGRLRIGIHVQGFDSGGSESLVNNPIPAPGAAVLAMIGLGMVGWRKRDRSH